MGKGEKPENSPCPPLRKGGMLRIQWLDGVRGMAIIWIVFFHCLLTYNDGHFPSPISLDSFLTFITQCGGGSLFGRFFCTLDAIIIAIIQRGAQPVGVFILFSGFGLTYSLFKGGRLEIAWAGWYRRRFTRLFPIFWLAHLIFLISPFAVLHDTIDYRFVLSLLGDRVYPVDKMFFYLVPAWWFLGLLIEFYMAFPLLFKLIRRLGWARYLGLCIVASVSAKVVLRILGANGDYEMGAFFVCRLWEFGAGMALGKLDGASPRSDFSAAAFMEGFSGGSDCLHSWTTDLPAEFLERFFRRPHGNRFICNTDSFGPSPGQGARAWQSLCPGRRVLLQHLSFSPALRYVYRRKTPSLLIWGFSECGLDSDSPNGTGVNEFRVHDQSRRGPFFTANL